MKQKILKVMSILIVGAMLLTGCNAQTNTTVETTTAETTTAETTTAETTTAETTIAETTTEEVVETTEVINDEDKNNLDIYPFIVDSVPKEVYEYPFKKGIASTPKEMYKYYPEWDFEYLYRSVEDYLEILFNVDYTNFNVDEYMNKLASYQAGLHYFKYVFEEYFTHIKENKIIITTNAQVQKPIIYETVTGYYVRVKLDIKIKSSNTNKNILIPHYTANDNFILNGDSTLYIDCQANLDNYGNVSIYTYGFHDTLDIY